MRKDLGMVAGTGSSGSVRYLALRRWIGQVVSGWRGCVCKWRTVSRRQQTPTVPSPWCQIACAFSKFEFSCKVATVASSIFILLAACWQFSWDAENGSGAGTTGWRCWIDSRARNRRVLNCADIFEQTLRAGLYTFNRWWWDTTGERIQRRMFFSGCPRNGTPNELVRLSTFPSPLASGPWCSRRQSWDCGTHPVATADKWLFLKYPSLTLLNVSLQEDPQMHIV